MGLALMESEPESVEALARVERLQKRLAAYDRATDLREYVMDDYLVAYAIKEAGRRSPSVIYLLAIKHRKQLSFDLERLWTTE